MKRSKLPKVLATYGITDFIPRADLHEYAVGLATKMYNDTGRVAPLWIIATYGKNRAPGLNGHYMLVVETDWATPDEKLWATESMRDFVNETEIGAYAYAFISEAWVATEKTGDKYDELRKQGAPVAPADRPAEDRDDILMIISFTRDGECALTRFLTHDRGGLGKNFLGPRTEMEAISPESRMCLFPVQKAKPQ